MEEFVDRPYEWARAQVAAGTAVPSFVSTLLAEDGKALDAQAEHDLKWTANSMYSGQSTPLALMTLSLTCAAASLDTTLTSVASFVHAMAAYPAAQAKAQAELARVVGHGRLPAFADRANLPYVDALMSEVFRWAAPVPVGLPHRLMEDDVYNGMHIPKGSFVFGNAWAMLRDERMYPDPEAFAPERFLEETLAARDADDALRARMDPRNYVFGFGRRSVPPPFTLFPR
jgi:cytochrome P450